MCQTFSIPFFQPHLFALVVKNRDFYHQQTNEVLTCEVRKYKFAFGWNKTAVKVEFKYFFGMLVHFLDIHFSLLIN